MLERGNLSWNLDDVHAVQGQTQMLEKPCEQPTSAHVLSESVGGSMSPGRDNRVRWTEAYPVEREAGTHPIKLEAGSHPIEREAGAHPIELEVELGRGGFATVWRGQWMHSKVAIKVFRVRDGARTLRP